MFYAGSWHFLVGIAVKQKTFTANCIDKRAKIHQLSRL